MGQVLEPIEFSRVRRLHKSWSLFAVDNVSAPSGLHVAAEEESRIKDALSLVEGAFIQFGKKPSKAFPPLKLRLIREILYYFLFLFLSFILKFNNILYVKK